MTGPDARPTLPRAKTAEGQAALDGLLAHPEDALIGLDFDGTLSPIVPDPRDARPVDGVVPVLQRLATKVGTLAVITGRPAAEAVAHGGFEAVPGLIVLGHYGLQRWQDGTLGSPPPVPALDVARKELPTLLDTGHGVWIEDKDHAIAVHTRRAADPEAALDRIRAPLTELAARLGLAAEPGRLVIELRPDGIDKGTALRALVRERNGRYVIFAGDDLGDLPAFAVVRALRGEGIAGCTVASASAERPEVAAAADLAVGGPEGVNRLLAAIAARLG